MTQSAAFASEPTPNRMAFVPHMEGELSTEFQSDNVYKSDDSANEISDTYTTTELGVTWHFTPWLQVVGTFVFEPVTDATSDRFFEGHGGYAEEIYARFVYGNFGLNAGKYDPVFGRAWDAAPGVYGTEFGEDYELVERQGFAATYETANYALGDVSLVASIFRLDTSKLSESAFTNRGRTTRADGGASNTSDLSSYAVDAQFSNIMKSGVGVNLGYRNQARGVGNVSDEEGFVAGLSGAHSLTKDANVEWLVEGVRWPRLSEQQNRIVKWIVCRGYAATRFGSSVK